MPTWVVAGSRGRQTPASPATADLEEAPAVAGWQTKRRHGIFGQLAHQVLIQTSVGGADGCFHEGIDLAGADVELRQLCRVAFLGHGQGASSLNMRLLSFGNQQDRNPLDDPVAVTGRTAEPIGLLAKRFFVAGTHQQFQEIVSKRLHRSAESTTNLVPVLATCQSKIQS